MNCLRPSFWTAFFLVSDGAMFFAPAHRASELTTIGCTNAEEFIVVPSDPAQKCANTWKFVPIFSEKIKFPIFHVISLHSIIKLIFSVLHGLQNFSENFPTCLGGHVSYVTCINF